MGDIKTMITVNSVSEYLDHVSSIKRIRVMSNTVSSFTFFRGQANLNWKISPSLYRKGLFKSESLLLTEIKHLCPSEIPENRFDALVKMQHFGMPTRLLDTTTNPLVALYFACENEFEKASDGVVYAFPNLPVSWSTDPLIEIIMDFVFDCYPERTPLDKMLKSIKEKYQYNSQRSIPNDINSLLYYLKIPAFAVMPAKTNERIEAQDGAFFIFGMNVRNYEVSTNPGTLGQIYYNFDPVDIDRPDKIWNNSETIIIPASAKDKILDQLYVLGINERKLFPDLTHQILHAVNSVTKSTI